MKKSLVLMLVIFSFLLTGQAGAQQSYEPDIEIVVTAGRVEEEADWIPASVSVITAEDIDASGQTTIVDLLKNLSGIHFRTSSGNASQAEISMRGFGENSHGRVLVLLDGRKLNRPDMAGINWLQIPLQSIERIEVVRGANSVLYGDHAVGGVINIITKRGTEDLSLSFSAQGGSFAFNQERAGLSGSAGALSFSVNGEHTSTDGYRERSGYRSIGLTTDLGWDSGGFITPSLSLSYEKLFFEMPGDLTKAEMEADPTQAENSADEVNEQHVNIDLGITAGRDESRQLAMNLIYGLKFIQNDIPSSFLPYTDLALHTFGFTPKLSLSGEMLATDNRFITGIDAYYDILKYDKFDEQARINKNLSFLVTKLALGFYLQDDLTVLDNLLLSAGARYDLALFKAETKLTEGTPIDDQKFHQAPVFDIGLVYGFGQSARVYARYGTLFRYPFTDEQVSMYGFGSDTFLTDLEAEKGWNLEVGAEVGFAGLLTLKSNFFLLDMEDEIAYNSLTFQNENMDNNRHLGFEGGILFAPLTWLELSGDYTYTKTTFTQGDNKGKEVPMVPNHKISGLTAISLPAGLTVTFSGNYTGESFVGGDPDNSQEKLAEYLLFDILCRFTPAGLKGKLELSFSIENIMDTMYASYAYYSGYYPAPGRSWKVGGSYQY